MERFGDYNASTGKYAIPSYVTSIMNSFPYLGKLIVSAQLEDPSTRTCTDLGLLTIGLLGCHTHRGETRPQARRPDHSALFIHVSSTNKPSHHLPYHEAV